MTGKTSQLFRQKINFIYAEDKFQGKIYKKNWEVKIEVSMEVYQKKSKKGSD